MRQRRVHKVGTLDLRQQLSCNSSPRDLHDLSLQWRRLAFIAQEQYLSQINYPLPYSLPHQISLTSGRAHIQLFPPPPLSPTLFLRPVMTLPALHSLSPSLSNCLATGFLFTGRCLDYARIYG